MNKSELIAAMAAGAGVSQKDAGACLDAMMDAVAGCVRLAAKLMFPDGYHSNK